MLSLLFRVFVLSLVVSVNVTWVFFLLHWGGKGPSGAHVAGDNKGEVRQGVKGQVVKGVPDDGLGGGGVPMVSLELLDLILSLLLVLTGLETLVNARVCGVNGLIVTLVPVLPVTGGVVT